MTWPCYIDYSHLHRISKLLLRDIRAGDVKWKSEILTGAAAAHRSYYESFSLVLFFPFLGGTLEASLCLRLRFLPPLFALSVMSRCLWTASWRLTVTARSYKQKHKNSQLPDLSWLPSVVELRFHLRPAVAAGKKTFHARRTSMMIPYIPCLVCQISLLITLSLLWCVIRKERTAERQNIEEWLKHCVTSVYFHLCFFSLFTYCTFKHPEWTPGLCSVNEYICKNQHPSFEHLTQG